MISVLLDALLGTIVAFLGLLCVQLNYSLMLSDVDAKTYEYGMLRALGYNKRNIMSTVLANGAAFAAPGILLGFVLAALSNYGARRAIYFYTQNSASLRLSPGSIALGVLVGVFIPLASMLLPIRQAFGKNLRQSLDLYHRAGGEMTLSMRSQQEFGLSLNQLLVAIMLVILGGLTYYVAPSAFLFQ